MKSNFLFTKMNHNLSLILSNLALTNAEQTTKNILWIYQEKGWCFVHFLYFATIVLTELDQEKSYSMQKIAFMAALRMGDFLLPDGIALKLLCKKYINKELPNLNGTDFLPYFLSHIPWDEKVEILLYWWHDVVVQKAAQHITSSFGHSVVSAQNGFVEFDWSSISKKEEDTIRILLIGRGSPRQEIWAENHRSKIESMECLVFSVGGLLDFWSGSEKRAPNWMRRFKIEWLYRAISHPRKNLKKTLVSLKLVRFLIQK